MQKSEQFIQFKLGSHDYVVESSFVREIIKPVKIIELVDAPEYIEGIAQVRDGIITVIDVRRKFNIVGSNAGSSRIIIFESSLATQAVGLRVDDVVEIVESSSIVSVPNIIRQSAFKEVIKTNDSVIPILDVEQFFMKDVLTWLDSENIEELTKSLKAVQDI